MRFSLLSGIARWMSRDMAHAATRTATDANGLSNSEIISSIPKA